MLSRWKEQPVVSDPNISRRSAAQEFHGAALQAQDLVLAAQAIEARVSSLSIDVPPAVVRETVSLIRAGSGQMALMLLELMVVACTWAERICPLAL